MTAPAAPPVSVLEQCKHVALAIGVAFPMVVGLTMANVALPAIMHSTGMRLQQAQLLSSGALLAATVCALVAAHAWKRFGARTTVSAALLVFTLGSVIAAAAPSAEGLILGRVLQGAAAGFVQPLSLLLVAPLFPADRRGMAMGLVGMGMLLAPAVGPVFAGWMVDRWGWRLLLLSLCPCSLLCLPFARRWLAPAADALPAGFDWGGLALVVAALGALMAALATPPHASHARASLLLGTAVIAGTAFIAWQWLHPRALLDPRLFARLGFGYYSVVLLVLGFGIFGSVLLVPLFLQTVAGYSSEAAGLALLPGGVAMALASPVCGYLCDRWSPVALLAIGLALFALSSFLLAGVAATDVPALALWVVVGRVALSLVFPAIYALSLYALPADDLPQGSSAVNFIRQLGGAFGTALLVLAIGQQEAGWIAAFGHGALADGSVLAARSALAGELTPLLGHGSPEAPDVAAALIGRDIAREARTEAFRDLFALTGWLFTACAVLSPVMAAWLRSRASRTVA